MGGGENDTSVDFSGTTDDPNDVRINVTATRPPSGFEVAVAPASIPNVTRDLMLTIKTEATAPTVTWPDNWAPRTSAEDDLTVEVGTNVYYITEYTPGKFVVARWLEREVSE